MTRTSHSCFCRVLFLIGVIIAMMYSNALDVPFYLDDFNHIVHNPKVQIADLNRETLSSFFNNVWVQGLLNRPLAVTTIAANWFLGGNNPAGYHLFNIVIHFLTAVGLYFALTLLLKTPRMKGALTTEQVEFISLLSGLLWAVNPIQTQAVTYIIQRMASLSAMFFIFSIWFYLLGRLAPERPKSYRYYLLCLTGAFAAFLCKENAATLPLSLVLVEAIFFQDLSKRATRIYFVSAAATAVIAIFILGVIAYFGRDFSSVLNYVDRPFTAWQRLLSQPRALIIYLSLILYPTPMRLSITHDFEVSTSLFQPWATFLSIVAVVFLIGLALWRMRGWPLLSFGILFFFTNHGVESSILPLELVFEHRNYLPSMFIFLPIVAGISRAIDHFRWKSRIVTIGLNALVPLLIVGLAAGTYIRNQAWKSEKTLWEDAVEKAPGESRPYLMLASCYYDRIGDFDTSIRLYQFSLGLRKPRISYEGLIYNNMGAAFYSRKNYLAAVELWQKTIQVLPGSKRGRFHLAVALSRINRFDEALAHLEEILKQNPEYFGPNNLKGVILIRQGNYLEAVASLRQSLKPGAIHRPALINLGAAYCYLGDHAKAAVFLREALKLNPNDRAAVTWLALNYLRAGETMAADEAITRLLGTGSAAVLKTWLSACVPSKFEDDEVVPPEVDDRFWGRLNIAWLRSMGDSAGIMSAIVSQFDPIE